jgi:hypothetical protein
MAIVTVAGETVSVELSLLVIVTVVPPAGAGVDKVTGKAMVWLSWTTRFDGRLMDPRAATETVAVTSARFGSDFAWIVAAPCEIAVTWTFTLVAFAGNETVDGTLATAGLSELNVIVSPAGAGAERVRVRVAVPPVPTVMLFGEKFRVAVTFTAPVAPTKPGADAVMLADPNLTPVTIGWVVGVVCPAAIKTLGGICAVDGSLLVRATVTPFTGAPVNKLIGKGLDWFGPTVTLAGRVMAPNFTTETLAVALVWPAAFAVMVAEPVATPVTVKVPVEPVAMVTLDGTVTIPFGLALRNTTTPAGGTGPDRVMVPFVLDPEPTTVESSANVMPTTDTFTATLAGTRPEAPARMNALPGKPDVRVTVALVAPSEIVMLEGTDAILVSVLNRLTLTPPGPAGPPSVTVRAPEEFVARFSGLGPNVIVLTPAEIVTVLGLLFANPLFTISCAT